MGVIAKEVKDEILQKIKTGETVSDISNKYGVSTKTIYTWLKHKAQSSISLIEHSRLKKENQSLKEIIGTLTIELSKAKKKVSD